jgi:aspartyl protease family protein
MLRFLGMYPVAIVLAMTFAAIMVKNNFPLRTKPNEMSAQAYAAAPVRNFSQITQDIEGNALGQYLTQAQINGRELHMIIDTGATLVSLTNEDASALGIRPAPSEFTIRLQTANGLTTAARVWLPQVRIGAVEVHDVEALVMGPDASRISLLGMSFLSRLNRFGVMGNHMRLEQ